MMIERLYTHTINVYRPTSLILDGATTVYNHTIGTTYNQAVLLELEIPDGDGTFVVTGTLNGLTSTSTVIFSNGGTVYKKPTDKSWTHIVSVEGTTGTATSFNAKTIGKSGQAVTTDVSIYTTLYCRMDNVMRGAPDIYKAGIVKPDSMLCFVSGNDVPEGSIRVDDKVIEGWTLDVTQLGTASTKTYIVKDVNSYYNRYNYIYTELILAKND